MRDELDAGSLARIFEPIERPTDLLAVPVQDSAVGGDDKARREARPVLEVIEQIAASGRLGVNGTYNARRFIYAVSSKTSHLGFKETKIEVGSGGVPVPPPSPVNFPPTTVSKFGPMLANRFAKSYTGRVGKPLEAGALRPARK